MKQQSRFVLLVLLLQSSSCWAEPELSVTLSALLERQNLANLAHIQQQGQHNQLNLQQQQDANMALIWQFGLNNQADLLQTGQGNALLLLQKGDDNHAIILQRGNHNFLQLEQQGSANFSIEQIGDGGAVSVTQY
jgi:minor curlin subunit